MSMLAINGGSPEALRAFSVAGGEYEAPPAAIGALFKEILGKAGVMVSESSSNADVDTSLCIICARPTRSAAALESLLRLLPAARLDDFKLQMAAFLTNATCLDAATAPMHSNSSNSSSSSSHRGSGGASNSGYGGEDSASGIAAAGLASDTLLHLLLRLRVLQLCALAAAVDSLLLLAQQQEDTGSRAHQLCLRLLGHIRWCEVVFEPWEMLSALLQATQALPPALQIEVIALVPGLWVQCALAPKGEIMGGASEESTRNAGAEVIESGESGFSSDAVISHSKGTHMNVQGANSGALSLCSQLLEMAESNVDLLAAVLDAVCHLAASCAAQPMARRAVMALAQQFAADSLSALHSSQLPAVSRFLLETADSAEAAREVLGVLRAKLGDFLSATKFSDSMEERSSQAVLYSVLVSGFRGNPLLLPALLAAVENEALAVIDIWILLSLGGQGVQSNKVMTAFARRATGATAEAVQRAVWGFAPSLDAAFAPMLRFAQLALGCSRLGAFSSASLVQEAVRFGAELYYILYMGFTSALNRQEVVAALVSSLSSPLSREIDGALAVLRRVSGAELALRVGGTMLVEATSALPPHITARAGEGGGPETTLVNFLPFLKSVLDDIEVFSVEQTRIIFKIIFDTNMASGNVHTFTSSQGHSSSSCGASVTSRAVAPAPPDDVMIFIRKYITGASQKLRHVAIAGAVAYLTQTSALALWLVSVRRGDAKLEMSPYDDMLVLLFNKACERAEDFAFLIDELCFALEKGHFTALGAHVNPFIDTLMSEAEDVLGRYLGGLPTSPSSGRSTGPGGDLASQRLQQLSQAVDDAGTQEVPLICGGVQTKTEFALYGNMNKIYVDMVRGVSVWYYRAALMQDAFMAGAAISVSSARSAAGFGGGLSATFASSQAVPADLAVQLRYGKACVVGSLPRVLRLCADCCLAAGNDLSPLAALLTCALRMPCGPCIDYNSRCIEVGTLIAALDWIRGIINAFCGELGVTEHAKLIERMNQMVELEHLIYEKMQLFPEFVKERLAASGVKQLRSAPKASASSSSRQAGQAEAQHQEQGEESRYTDDFSEAAKAPLIPISVISHLVDQLILPLKPHVVQVLGYARSSSGSGGAGLSAPATACLIELATKSLIRDLKEADGGPAATRAHVFEAFHEYSEYGVFNKFHDILERCAYGLDGDSRNEGDAISQEKTSRDDIVLECFGSQFYSSSSASFLRGVHDESGVGQGVASQILVLIRAVFQSQALRNELVAFMKSSSGSGATRPPVIIRFACSLAAPQRSPAAATTRRWAELLFESLITVLSLLERIGLGLLNATSEALQPLVHAIETCDTVLDFSIFLCGPSGGQLLPVIDGLPEVVAASRKRLSERCDAALQRPRDGAANIKTKSLSSKIVRLLLDTTLRHAPDTLAKIHFFAGSVLHPIVTDGQQHHVYAVLGASPQPFAAACACLLEAIRELFLRATVPDATPADADRICDIVADFALIVGLSRKHEDAAVMTNQTLGVILKNGRSFLELFLRRSRAVHALFSAHRDPAMQTLHTLQKATRQLQSICSYGKIRRDKTLSSEAPYLKRALERLIYDMKDMASENRCLGAVWVGTLKHRHIDGSEVRASDDEAAYEDEDEEEEQSDLGKIPDEEEEEEEEDDDEEGEQEEASTGPESKDAGNGRLGSSSSNSSRLPNKRPLDDLDASYREPMPPLPRRPRRVVDSSEESSNDS